MKKYHQEPALKNSVVIKGMQGYAIWYSTLAA
jgi:hypothetical protein